VLAIKQLRPIKYLFNVLTLENFHTRKHRKDDAEMICIWFKYQINSRGNVVNIIPKKTIRHAHNRNALKIEKNDQPT
jgi:hypothetical protein